MREPGDDEPFLTTMQWSRRFAGLKVALALASRASTAWPRTSTGSSPSATGCAQGSSRDGFEVVNDTALPVVCFTPQFRNGAVPTRKLVQGLWRRGERGSPTRRWAGASRQFARA